MFEFLTLKFLGLGSPSDPTPLPTYPIEVQAEQLLQNAVESTVRQLNVACEKVCYGEKQQ